MWMEEYIYNSSLFPEDYGIYLYIRTVPSVQSWGYTADCTVKAGILLLLSVMPTIYKACSMKLLAPGDLEHKLLWEQD